MSLPAVFAQPNFAATPVRFGMWGQRKSQPALPDKSVVSVIDINSEYDLTAPNLKDPNTTLFILA